MRVSSLGVWSTDEALEKSGGLNHVYLIQGSGVYSDHILNRQVVRLCDKFNVGLRSPPCGRYLDSLGGGISSWSGVLP
jgi:hypothetical protein